MISKDNGYSVVVLNFFLFLCCCCCCCCVQNVIAVAIIERRVSLMELHNLSKQIIRQKLFSIYRNIDFYTFLCFFYFSSHFLIIFWFLCLSEQHKFLSRDWLHRWSSSFNWNDVLYFCQNPKQKRSITLSSFSN